MAREGSAGPTLDGDHRPGRFYDYAEDATGFGAVEFRTARDLLLRPRDVLRVYLDGGSTGGGRYARPVRFYVALCGVLLFYLFLIGGTRPWLEDMPAGLLDPLVARSGKSREAFMSDADGWMSFVAVPVLAFFYALGIAPLLKWWGRSGWRVAFRATFALLCAWTVPFIPFGPLPYLERYQPVGSALLLAFLIIAFLRMGRGVWWTGWPEAAGKSVLICLALNLAALAGLFPVLAIGVLGGLYGS